jgi:hypothetical protein
MMKRVLIPLVVAAGLLGPPAHAAATEERIVSELREQGFTRVEIRRTLLGRTRIVATSPTYEREIILNPSSGVILRDFWTVRGEVGNEAPSRIVGGPNLRDGGSGSRATSGSSGGDSDDDDSSGGSSGSGSSGSSGSGSSGSASDDADDDDDDDSSSGGDDSDNDDDDDDDSGSGSDDSDDDDDDDD